MNRFFLKSQEFLISNFTEKLLDLLDALDKIEAKSHEKKSISC